MRSLLRLHTRLTGIVALFVFVGLADTRAEPSPAAFAAMCRGEPIPLADRPGAITAGRPASSKFPWKPVASGWQRLDDNNVTAWRRGEGPVELIAMASTHADGEDLSITGFGGVTIGAEGERHGILLTRWPGLLNVRFDERFYRTAPGTTSLEVPLTDGKSLTFELRDQIPLIEAALTAGDATRALILFKPFRNWPQLAALHKRVWDAQTDQLATAGFAGTHYRELVQRGTKTWRELDAQGYVGERRVENAIMLAVQRRLVAGDPLAQAHARTLPIGPFISKSDAEFDRIIAEGAALLAPGQIGPVETAVRGVLAKQPAEWKSAPFAKESPSSREVTFLTAARTFDRPVGARPGALQSATVVMGALVESVPRTDLESVLAREVPLAYAAAARAAEAAGWPATAAGLHLHACQVVSKRIDDLAVLAPSLRSENESDAAAARRLVGGLLLLVWPKLSPQHPETARLVQLLALGDSLCTAPAVCVLGLQPGSPEGLLAAINRVRPADPVLAFSGYQRFSAAEKAEPVMWPRTFYAGINPNDPEAVAWGRVNRAEAALRAATKSHFNIAELEARLARTYALRDHYGSVHREQMTEVARGQGSLNQVHPLEEVLMNASLKPAYESAKKELQNQLAAGRANAESIRTEWNVVDREANSLSREIAEYRRDAPNSATVAKLEAEVSAARSQLGAAAKTAARTKRFAHVGHDRHREEPLLSLVFRQITDLEKSVLTKPDSPERLAELQWLHWWLGIQDKAVPPLPKVSQPSPILNQRFVEARFFHEIETALGQNDAITPMLAAITNARARSLPGKREKLVQDGLLAFGLATPLSESGELRKRMVK